MIHDAPRDAPISKVLDALSANGGKPKRSGSWLMCRCPAHADGSASLGVTEGESGKVVLKCHAGCAVEAIVSAIGLEMRDLFPPDSAPVTDIRSKAPARVATLDELAQHKKLAPDFLRSLGWRDNARGGVDIPYVRRDGQLHVTKTRRGLSIKDGTYVAPAGKPLAAYEPDNGELARSEGYVIVCEGETDTATLLYAGFPALGLPGADSVERTLEAHHVEGLHRVFYVREPDQGGDKFAKLVPERLKALGFVGEAFELKLPGSAKDPSALWQRDPAKFRELLSELLREVSAGPFKWLGVSDIFQSLPDVRWVVPGLQIGPGRPSVIVGYGASAKTISAQALALAVAAGVQAWGNFETRRGRVRHMDYEQGRRATSRRYQRLAVGMDMAPEDFDGRLELSVFPSVYLDSENAADAYARASEGIDLIILDALRGATPTKEENDSSIRTCIDNLTHASEKTGCSFLLIHHSGKPRDGAGSGVGDARMNLRGSSAIFDGAGCVIELRASDGKAGPKRVLQSKLPADATGIGFQEFDLVVQDIARGEDPFAGLRVLYQPLIDPLAKAQQDAEWRMKRQYEAVAGVVMAMKGRSFSKTTIVTSSGVKRADAILVFEEMVSRGDLIEAGADARGHELFQLKPGGSL